MVVFCGTVYSGLLNFADGPLNPDHQSVNMSDMFRPFQTLLYKIRSVVNIVNQSVVVNSSCLHHY